MTALFKLSQIFTREASSPPLSLFESSYRSVRATQPSSFPSSDGPPRISSSRHSTCDKNRDLLPSSPRDVSINPQPPRPPAPWRHCRVPLLLNVPVTGLSERAFAVIARLVSTTSIFWRRYPHERPEPLFFSPLPLLVQAVDTLSEILPRHERDHTTQSAIMAQQQAQNVMRRYVGNVSSGRPVLAGIEGKAFGQLLWEQLGCAELCCGTCNSCWLASVLLQRL